MKKNEKTHPWTTVSAADIQAKIDRVLVEKRSIKPASGTVLVPRREVSVKSALLDVLGSQRLRREAEEFLEGESLMDIFRPFLSKEPRWVLKCSATDSMVSGSWGLKYFRLGRRGYLYHEPDWGADEDDSRSILCAWEPVEDTQAFRACFLNAYTRTWDEFGFPPCMGQWAKGPFEVMLEAVCTVLKRDDSGWPDVLERLQKDEGSGPTEFDEFVDETAKQTGLPASVVSGVLRPPWEGSEAKSLANPKKLRTEELRSLVGAFLIVIGRGGF